MSLLPPLPSDSRKYILTSQNNSLIWELDSNQDLNIITKPKKKFLIVLAGQSNCQSANSGPRTLDDATNPRIFMLSHNIKTTFKQTQAPYLVAPLNMWQVACDPLQHWCLADPNSIGFGLTMAKEYLKTLGPQDEIYLVCGALGGSSFDVQNYGLGNFSWLITANSNYHPLFKDLVRDTKFALSSMPDLELKALLWHQGESSVNDLFYEQRLTELIMQYRKEVNNTNLPFICGTMLKKWKDSDIARTSRVDLIHKNISNKIWLASCANFDDLTGCEPDNIHFNAVSQREMGRRYCSELIKVETKYQAALVEWLKTNK
jgi:hypothetical protein